MSTSIPVVELSNVSKSFGSNKVLSDVSFSVENGEILALLGPSGCGKSTLLKILAGFFDPDSGVVSLRGQPINGVPPYKRNLGMVFQDYSLFPHMTIYDNVAFGLSVRKHAQREISERVAYALELVQLPEVADRFPSQLSGGQQQRVAIARALAVNPSVLLCDEPLSNLDAGLRKNIQLELRRIQRETGITMVYVTHDQEEAITLADRIALLNAGQIEQLDPPQTVFEHPTSLFAAKFLGYTNFFEANVVGQSDSILTVQLPGEHVVEIDVLQPYPQSKQVTVCIREERIELYRRGEGAAAPTADRAAAMIPSTITEIVYTGTDYSIVAEDASGAALRARISVQAFHKDHFAEGTPVWIRLTANNLRVVQGGTLS